MTNLMRQGACERTEPHLYLNMFRDGCPCQKDYPPFDEHALANTTCPTAHLVSHLVQYDPGSIHVTRDFLPQ